MHFTPLRCWFYPLHVLKGLKCFGSVHFGVLDADLRGVRQFCVTLTAQLALYQAAFLFSDLGDPAHRSGSVERSLLTLLRLESRDFPLEIERRGLLVVLGVAVSDQFCLRLPAASLLPLFKRIETVFFAILVVPLSPLGRTLFSLIWSQLNRGGSHPSHHGVLGVVVGRQSH